MTNILVLMLTVSIAPSADWPQFRGPGRDGVSAATGLARTWPQSGPGVLWKSEGLGEGFSSVSIAGNLICTMGDIEKQCHVVGIDRETGKVLWKTAIGKDGGNYKGPRCTPTQDAGKVYALGQHGDLVCINGKDGKIVWRKDLIKEFGGMAGGWNYTESPLVDGDRLVCTPGGRMASIVCLDKSSGKPIWRCPIGESAGYSSVVISNACGVKQYVQLLSNGLAGVRASDGALLWRYGEKDHFKGNTANIPTPIVRGDEVFASAGYGRGAGLVKLTKEGNGIKATEVYFNKELTNKHGGMIALGDHVYGDADDRGTPQCAEWATGKVAWKRQGARQGRGSASITAADGMLVIRYQDGWVHLVEAGSDKPYKELAQFKIVGSDTNSWAHPVVLDGKLYLREKGFLWCYDIAAR
ncbi:MAG: PQQ-binding-like beta-propeller repeat protein [Planctomycetota bacterium]